MGLLDRIKKTKRIDIAVEKGKIYAPLTGKYIPLDTVEDQVFSSGTLGLGCGIQPEEGMLYAPVSGTVTMIADTKHAIGISTEEGAEYLLHIGLDTVDMNGKGFEVQVKEGQSVTAGQLLMKFNMQMIQDAGHSTTTVFVLTNADEFEKFNICTQCHMAAGTEVGNL